MAVFCFNINSHNHNFFIVMMAYQTAQLSQYLFEVRTHSGCSSSSSKFFPIE